MHVFDAQVFGDYVLHDRIGAGGMAEIFLATAQGIEGFEKRLVIKRILPTLSDDEQFVRMFIEEAKLCVALRHPNIVQVYDLGEIDFQYFIAMEYVDGRDLLKTLAACGRKKIGFPTDIALYIVMEVLKGLDYAHKLIRPDGEPLGIIHRDVSPSNVLLSFEGEVKIGDFGIAKASTREKTATGILKGKFGYMAPEQVTGAKIDHKADIFAVGIVLYELLTGHRLFAGKNDLAVLERVRDAVIDPPPRFYRADLDPELENIVLTALSKDPNHRYETSTDLHDALHDYVYRSRALIGPAHLGRFMQTLFLSEPEELDRRNRVSLPLFGREAPAGADPTGPVKAREPEFGAEATEDERSAFRDDVSGLIDRDAAGDFEEMTPLLDIGEPEEAPTRNESALSDQVAFIEDASSFERNVELPEPTVDPQALLRDVETSGRKRNVSRTARTDLTEPPEDDHTHDDAELEVGSEVIVGFTVERTEEDGVDHAQVAARAEVQAIRRQREQNAETDFELDKDPRFPRNATPTPQTVDPARTHKQDRAASAIDTDLRESEDIRAELAEAGPSSGRSFSPAEIVERTVSHLDPVSEEEAQAIASEIEPTVRFDSSIYPALRDDLPTGSTTIPSPEPLESSRPPLTDEYPDDDDSHFGTLEVQESDMPTAQVDESILSQLDLDDPTESGDRNPSVTQGALDAREPLVQAVREAEESLDPTMTGEEHLEADDETELTAEIDEGVREALARERDFVSVIDTQTIDDEEGQDLRDSFDATEPEPIAERTRKPSRRRPITARRPRPVLLPAAEDNRDNLARRPSTRSILPRPVSPKRRVTTRAALSVVNPRDDSTTNRKNGRVVDPRDETGRGELVNEDTIDGSFDDAIVTPEIGVLPDRRNSSGITAALDEAERIKDEIAEIRRTSSVATHEPTAMGSLADALDRGANLPVIDFEADEPTQDGSHLQDAIRRRQSRRKMVTRSVVLYGDEARGANAELHQEFEGEHSAPAITSAGQLEDPDAVDLFGALSVLDDPGGELGFDDDDVSLETVSRDKHRPSASLDERQAILVPPTEPTSIPDSTRPSRGVSRVDPVEFTDTGPATTRGSSYPSDDDGYELDFRDDEEETASVTDGQVVSISQLIGIPSHTPEPDVVELGGHDSLDAPNPSSVSISFGSMSADVLDVQTSDHEQGEFPTVNEEDEHRDEINHLRSGPLGIADETTAGGESDIMAGLPDSLMEDGTSNERGGLLVSESFDFGVDRQASLRGPAARRPSPTSPPPPVRPVSMVRAPGGVDPDEYDEPSPAPAQRAQARNASALRAVVERHRVAREKNRGQPTPERATGTPAAPPSPPTPPPYAAKPSFGGKSMLPMGATGTAPVRKRGAPATRSVGEAYPPIAQVQVRRTSFWTTLMYVMVGIAVILAVAAAVSSVLLKNKAENRGSVPIAPIRPTESQPSEKTAANDVLNTPSDAASNDDVAPPAPDKEDVPPVAPPPPPPPPAKVAPPPPPPPPTKVAPPPPPAKVAPPPPPPVKRAVKKRSSKPKRRASRNRARSEISINCREPATIKISKIGKFEGQTRFSRAVPPGDYSVSIKRGGRAYRSSVTVVAGRTAEVQCP